MTKRKKGIKTGLIERGLTFAKLGIKTGQLVAKKAVRSALAQAADSEIAHTALLSYAQNLAKELGVMKGSAMKVGQMLSTYGEYFLPQEVNSVLKSLQSQSPPLEWPQIEAILKAELGEAKLDQLIIDQMPWAAASIGQVHRARHKETGHELALKIQYPGVDRAIDLDILFLKGLLKVSPLIPKGPKLDAILTEVKTMLHRETNYLIEAESAKKVIQQVRGDDRYLVPEVVDEFSTRRVLASQFIVGHAVDSNEVQSLSMARRNRLGLAFLEHYLKELLVYRFVQTDAHLGNFQIQIDSKGENDRLVMMDFGAMREVEADFLTNFFKVLKGSILQDRELIRNGGMGLGILEKNDPQELIERYIDLCFLITEPFADPIWQFAPGRLMSQTGAYNWKISDLPHRVAKQGLKMALGQPLRAPPAPTVFLDRKLGGTFIFLQVLGCEVQSRDLLLHWIEVSKVN